MKKLFQISFILILMVIISLVFYYQRYDYSFVAVKRHTNNSIFLYSLNTINFNETNSTSSPIYSTAKPTDIGISIEACNDVIKKYNISKNNFVLGLSYWEQLTMATTNLCSLTAFSRHWHARTVEPFTRNAEMWGLPSTLHYPVFHGMPPIYKAGPAKPLNSLFNMTLFNSHMLCSKYDIPPLADFEEFMLNANRGIRLLHFNFNAYGKQIPTAKEFSENNHYINCLGHSYLKDFSSRLLSYLNAEASKRSLPSFTVDAACCVNHRHLTTPEEMASKCGFQDLDGLTVVIPIWRGYSELPTKKFRLVVPVDSPVLHRPLSSDVSFPLNNRLLSNVTAYCHDISEGRDFIGVHIRTAKLGMLDYISRKKLSTKCFDMTWELISKLQKEFPELPIKYFVDFGTYGSHSSEIGLGKRVSKKPFAQRKINHIHYNPEKHDGWIDQGFVALVEQSAISNAKVLVMVGGGSFQDQILTRFKDQGTGNNVYTICWTKDSLFVSKVV